MAEVRRICVIFNPSAGRGRARRYVQRRLKADPSIELCPTQYAGHAEELAYQAACDGFQRIIAAGGDGTIHEVANGLLRANRPEVILGIWPCGSADDYAYALGITGDPHQPTEVAAVDIGLLTDAAGRQRFFVNGMGVGFNGAVTLESRRIRCLRGMPLYTAALLRALVRWFDKPMMTAEFDSQTRQVPTLALSLSLGQREGGFPLVPHADLSDGWFDYIHAGPVSRYELLRHFPDILRGTLPQDHPRLWLGRCQRLVLRSESALRIHVDGEFFCQPEDGVYSVSATLLPRRLRVVRAAAGSVSASAIALDAAAGSMSASASAPSVAPAAPTPAPTNSSR